MAETCFLGIPASSAMSARSCSKGARSWSSGSPATAMLASFCLVAAPKAEIADARVRVVMPDGVYSATWRAAVRARRARLARRARAAESSHSRSSGRCSSAASIPVSAPGLGRTIRTGTRSCCWSSRWCPPVADRMGSGEDRDRGRAGRCGSRQVRRGAEETPERGRAPAAGVSRAARDRQPAEAAGTSLAPRDPSAEGQNSPLQSRHELCAEMYTAAGGRSLND